MKSNFLKFYLEADPGGDGGGGGQQFVPLGNISGGSDQQAADLAKAQQEQQAEALNEDGTLKDGYEKDASGKIVKTVPAGGDDNDDDDDDNSNDGTGGTDDPLAFWADVDKLRGKPIEIDWSTHKDAEGNAIDPISPEGVYIREKIIEDTAIASYDEYLKKSRPRAYAYMLHTDAGGTDEEFFNFKSVALPEYDEFKESQDLQVKVYKSSLVNMGLDDEAAQLLVDKAFKDGKLFDQAEKAFKAQELADKKMLEDLDKSNKEANEKYLQEVNTLNTTLTSMINEGKGLKIAIPDTDKPAFLQFVKERIHYDNGNFIIAEKLGNETERLLEALYLLHKKGDLSSLIVRKAQQQNTARLKRKVEASKANRTGSQEDLTQKPEFVPLGAINGK
jgi:hypothetical protein